MMIAFLHTSNIHINRFENLVKKYNNTIATQHFVNEDLLSYALQNNALDKKKFAQEIEHIKKSDPDLIICTCSTYGDECCEENQVARIDFPIANYLVENYTKIGLVFTVKSTQQVSENLIKEIAHKKQKNIEIVSIDCSSAWTHFEKNQQGMYEKSIAQEIEKNIAKVDVIFLAQASMDGAKKYITNTNKEIFTSPEYGIKYYLEKLKLW